MGWKGFMRGLQAAARQAERDARRRERAHEQAVRARAVQERRAVAAQKRDAREAMQERKRLLEAMKALEKADERARARNELELYENYVSTLVSIHKECWLPWTWEAVAQSAPPQPPAYLPIAENAARAAAAQYVPSVGERMLGKDMVRRSELNAAIENARNYDRAMYEQALAAHGFEYGRWEWLRRVSGGVLAGDPHAYAAVIEYLAPFDELDDIGSEVTVTPATPWCLEARVAVRDPEVVPNEVYSLKANGTLSTKAMPKGRYWELYQDHVCSCALRVARELFALLPVDVALVNIEALTLDKATGHQVMAPILSVGFARATVERLNLDTLDPSDSMSNFVHRMNFSKSNGLQRVDPLTAVEFRPSSTRWTAHAALVVGANDIAKAG